MKICQRCGQTASADQNFCPRCGNQLPSEITSVQNQPNNVAQSSGSFTPNYQSGQNSPSTDSLGQFNYQQAPGFPDQSRFQPKQKKRRELYIGLGISALAVLLLCLVGVGGGIYWYGQIKLPDGIFPKRVGNYELSERPFHLKGTVGYTGYAGESKTEGHYTGGGATVYHGVYILNSSIDANALMKQIVQGYVNQGGTLLEDFPYYNGAQEAGKRVVIKRAPPEGLEIWWTKDNWLCKAAGNSEDDVRRFIKNLPYGANSLSDRFPALVSRYQRGKIQTDVTQDLKKDSVESFVTNYTSQAVSASKKNVVFVIVRYPSTERAEQAVQNKVRDMQESTIAKADVIDSGAKTIAGRNVGLRTVLRSTFMEQVVWNEDDVFMLVTSSAGDALDFESKLDNQ